MTDPPKPPEILNRFVRMVLSYHPKPKSQPAKKRQRLAREARRAGQMPGAVMNQLMSLEEAYDTLDDLLCDFRNEMLRRHNRTMSPERWIAEFTAWLPTGIEFAERHAETIKSLESQ